MAFDLVGKLGEKMEWKDGGAEKVLLHSLVSGIMAEINGGKFGDGLTVGAINEILISELAKLKDGQGNLLISTDIMQWISAGAGGVLGRSQGAGISSSATKNNWSAHQAIVSVAPFRSETTLKILINKDGDVADIPLTAGGSLGVTAYISEDNNVHVFLTYGGSVGFSVYDMDYSVGSVFGWGGDKEARQTLEGLSFGGTIMAGGYFQYTNNGWIPSTVAVGLGTNAKAEVGATYAVYLGSTDGLLYDIKNSLSQMNVDTKAIDKLINKIESK